MSRLARALPLVLSIGLGCSDTIYNITEQPLDGSVKDSSSNGDTSAPTIDAETRDGADDAGDATSDSEPIADAGGDVIAMHDAGADTASGSLNGCSDGDFIDYSNAAASRVVKFPYGDPFLPDSAIINYAPPCMHIKAGEHVTWVGDFASSPLVANDGNPLNPIPTTPVDDAGADGSFTATFTIPGRYGYLCASHGQMRGAIEVVP
jgi:plastocyanin